ISTRKKRKAGILEGEEAADDTEPLSFESAAPPKASAPGDPVKAQEFFQAGAAFYEQGQYAQAVQNFHYAVQAQADLWQAYQYLGAAYDAQAMVNEAMGAYERMLELNPDESLRAWFEEWKVQAGAAPGVEAAG